MHKERTAFILFTDIYRSTQLWEKFPRDFKTSLEKHNTAGDYYGAARATHLKGLAIKREIGDRNGASFSLNNLGNIAVRQRDYAQAAEWLREALQIAKEIKSVIAIAAPLAISAGLFAATGDFAACGILAYGALFHEKNLGTPFDPMDKGMLDEGMRKLSESIAADKLAELKSRAEKMSLDELVDFGLDVLGK